MIILDTNVISEPLRAQPDPGVLIWLDAQIVETLFLTTISLAEIRYGIAAIAKHNGHTVASRDTAPFMAADVPVINPFASASLGE